MAGVALSALWALLRGGPFRDSLEIAFYVIAGLMFLLAAAGGSPSRRDASSAGWMERWANPETFAINRANPPERTLGPSVVFAVVGIALVVIAALLGAQEPR